jgi:aspartyl-tRNA(Asn)/glutamyl-tRNA(Gln) amidotransferase subunit C
VVDHKDIVNIAKLARLNINEAEAQEYSYQLSKMLEYFEQISKVNTEGVEPLVTPTDFKATWRTDIAKSETTAAEIVENAPDRNGNLFTVPPVV